MVVFSNPPALIRTKRLTAVSPKDGRLYGFDLSDNKLLYPFAVNGGQRAAVATGCVSPAFPAEIRRAKIAILGLEREGGSQ